MNAIILLLPLLLLVTPAIAHATNEGSYKFGFSVGFSDYNHCFDNDADALDCSPPDNDAPLQVCVNNPVNHEVTNSTACIDGYVQGWQHWCKSDAKDCVDFMLSGRFPGALIYGKNVYHGTDGNYIKVPSIPPILPRPPTAPKGGTCPPGMYLDQTLGVYHCHDAHGTHEPAPANMTNQWHRVGNQSK